MRVITKYAKRSPDNKLPCLGQWASTWTFGPKLPRALNLARAAPLENRLLLTGGLDDQGTFHDSVRAPVKT